jgi:hypothetical protein
MKIRFLAALTILFCLFQETAWSFGIEGLPGSAWISTSSDLSQIDGVSSQGNVRQGVQWFTLPGEFTFVSYLSYRWRFRTLYNLYFNEHGPVLGLELSRDTVSFGIQQEWQNLSAQGTSLAYPSLYLTWFKVKDLLSGGRSLFGIPVLSVPLSSWGRVMDDFQNYEGLGTLGYLSLGVDWFHVVHEVRFRTQVLYYWRFREKNEAYYNLHGPAVGAELSKGSINLGTSFGLETYPSLGRIAHTFRIYLNGYFDWDLKASGP